MNTNKKTIIGIDVGGSTTKIVGFRTGGGELQLIEPQFVRANDPITSIYGAFGKFTLENGLSLSDIDRVMMTGVGSSFVTTPIYGLECQKVPEFTCVGLGGLYLSGLDEAIVVSMGTGTALIHAKKEGDKTDIKVHRDNNISANTLMLTGTVARPTTIYIPVNNLQRYFNVQLTKALENRKIYLKHAFVPNKLSEKDVLVNEITHNIDKALNDVLKNSNNF